MIDRTPEIANNGISGVVLCHLALIVLGMVFCMHSQFQSIYLTGNNFYVILSQKNILRRKNGKKFLAWLRFGYGSFAIISEK